MLQIRWYRNRNICHHDGSQDRLPRDTARALGLPFPFGDRSSRKLTPMGARGLSHDQRCQPIAAEVSELTELYKRC